MKKKWNSVVVSCIALLFIAITVVNVNLAFNSDSAIVPSLALVDIETLAYGESDDNYTCSSGGPGSSSCSVSVDGSVAGGGLSTSCSVDCTSGYYACCNAMKNKCQCRKN
jgi:hypothetical protein